MSKRLLVYVEGESEEFFVNRVLRNYLLVHRVHIERPILAAKPGGLRGGFVSWPAVEADLRTIFAQDSDPNLRFTTFLDVYALPTDVPGYTPATAQSRTAAEVDAIESAWATHFGEPRFAPYLQRHEFEALVLAYPPALRAIFPDQALALTTLEMSITTFASAEEINGGSTTHPSTRLEQAIPIYGPLKASNGLFVIQEAGLDHIRLRCPRFDAWLKRWEAWGDAS